LELLARLPYLLAIDLIDRLILPYSDRAFTAVMRGSQCLVYLFGEATIVAAIALAYRHAAQSAPADSRAALTQPPASGKPPIS
jgi:hypothetical protein